MKDNELNKKIISYILRYIPENIKNVTFFTDLLNLSDESAYRRLRGDIPLTVEELYILSQELNFSIDDALAKDLPDNKALFDLKTDILAHPEETFLNILKTYSDDVSKERNAENRIGLISLNHLILPFTFRYASLFKFNYYKWIHQTQDVSFNFSYSDVVITSEMNSLRSKAAELSDSVDNTIIIVDQNMYLHTIKDIQYYYRRNLLTQDELQLIKKEFLFMIEQTEKVVQTGFNRFGKSRFFYLSPLSIKSNIILVEYDGEMISHIWYNSLTPISTSNPKLCQAHKRWLNSLKKYSSLISQSNEILSAEFFNKQREYINEMDVNMY